MPAPARRSPSSPASPSARPRSPALPRGGSATGAARRPRWAARVTLGVSALVLLASGVGHGVMTGIDSDVRRVDPFHGLKERPGTTGTGGVNFLIVGTDRRDELSSKERRKYKLGGSACDCTDTLLLVHLSQNHDRASVVSLPRDSYAELPAHTDSATHAHHPARPAKLNSAYAHGGPNLTVRTVESMTDVHIDHYMEIDFASFMRTVDVLGGVPVCAARPLKDSYSGLDLPAGTTRLDGGQALQYVRARHLDGAADLGRMRRQQRFLASVISKATEAGVLMNPVKFKKVASALLGSVRADPGFGSDEMMALGQAMRGFTPASSEFASVPIANPNHMAPGIGSTVLWDETKAGKLFATLREDRPLTGDEQQAGGGGKGEGSETNGKAKDEAGEGTTGGGPSVQVAPSSIRVQVENGTTRPGLAHDADQALRSGGFRTTGVPRNAERSGAVHTVITYDPRFDRSARSLAAAFPGSELKKEEKRGPVMRVTLGADYTGVRPVHEAGSAPAQEAPAEAAGPGSAGSGNGAVTGDRVACS